MKIKEINQRGAFLVIFALVLLVLLGFTALGIEAGRWYLVRAELSKSVDSAALVAAKNISNPSVDPKDLAIEFGYENFYAGYLGTPGAGVGQVHFTAQSIGSDTFQVTANVNAPATVARLFGVDMVPVVAVAAAQEASKKKTEIMLVLDRTGSMAGPKLRDLQRAAYGFVESFRGTQDKDKMGMISFATDVQVDVPLRDQFVDRIEAKIASLYAAGATNMEDALDQADGPEGLRNQSRLDKGDKLQQNIVFFSDGMPTAFRYIFRTANKDYDSVAGVAAAARTAANCKPGPGEQNTMEVWFYRPNVPPYQEGSGMPEVTPFTGDGKPWQQSNSSCIKRDTTRWTIFEDGYGAPPGYAKDACNIPQVDLALHTCWIARGMTLAKAQELKGKGIKIWVIGLGSDDDIDVALLKEISSGSSYTFIARDSSELGGLFNKVAKEIKLRLVQ